MGEEEGRGERGGVGSCRGARRKPREISSTKFGGKRSLGLLGACSARLNFKRAMSARLPQMGLSRRRRIIRDNTIQNQLLLAA